MRPRAWNRWPFTASAAATPNSSQNQAGQSDTAMTPKRPVSPMLLKGSLVQSDVVSASPIEMPQPIMRPSPA